MEQIVSYMSSTGVDQEEWERIFGRKQSESDVSIDEYNEVYRDVLERGKTLLSEEEWNEWFPQKRLEKSIQKPVMENV